jgi:hypothetical protein
MLDWMDWRMMDWSDGLEVGEGKRYLIEAVGTRKKKTLLSSFFY